KKQESVQDVPISMTALSKELQDSTIRDLADIEGYAPNVVFNDGASGGGGRGTRIIIRGIAGSAIGEKSFDNPIAVSLDGIFFNSDSGRIVQNFDVERVEVLRGPQGTLFGRNTVGGVINVIRTRPTGELGGKLRVTAGRYGQEEVRGLLNFPVTDELAAKVYYVSVKSDGPLDRTFDGGHAPKVDYENYGIQLLWEPNEKFDALLAYDRYNNASDGGAPTNWNNSGGVVPGIAFSFPCLFFGDCGGNGKTVGDVGDSVDANNRNSGDYRNDVISLTMKYQINDNLTLISTTGNHDTPYEDTIRDFDGSSLDFIAIDNRNEYEQFSTEFRLEGGFDRFDFVVGAYYLDSQYDQDWVTFGSFRSILKPAISAAGLPTGDLANDPVAVAACASGVHDPYWCDVSFAPGGANFGQALGPNYDGRLFQTQKTESLAFFGHIDYEINEKLIATAGVRWTEDTKDFIGYQAYGGAVALRYPFNFNVPHIELSNKWDETTVKIGLAYHATEDVMFFGSWAQGFKSGGFYGVNQNIRDFSRNQYDPETADSFEIGMKSQWLDNRLQLNVAAFLNDFKDKQDSNVVRDEDTNTVATVWENQSSVQYYGVEVETRFVVTENLDLFATTGWLHAEYDKFLSLGAIPADELNDDSVPIDASGFNPKYAPEWTFGFGGTYTRQVGPGELSLHLKYNYVDAQDTDTFNDPGTEIPETEFVSAQVAYDWNQIRVTAFGENLLDEQFENVSCLSVLFCTGGIQAGTTYGVEIEMIFGN
ncbi:MAG: iron complex outermembrane receptor protein, partial [Candidatus Azotimanducaceae bacterium]